MKVIVMVKATADSEAAVMPSEEMMAAMGNYNEELVKAGIMLSGEGLHPSSKGVRVRFSGQNRSVIDGPFAETKELVAGFWMWQVKSMQEAVEWVKRCPNPMLTDSEIEIRPVFEAEDFGEAYTPELREQEDRMRAEVESYQLEAPRFEVGRERLVAGYQGHFSGQTRAEIPRLWERFMPERGRHGDLWSGPDDYGVTYNFQQNGFDYIAGSEVKPGATLPDGVTSVTLPAQRYAVFTHKGDVSTIDKTCDAIFGKWLPNSSHEQADAPFFERYTQDFDTKTMSGGIELWVPIKT